MRTNKQNVLMAPCSHQIRFTVGDNPKIVCALAIEAVNETSYPMKGFSLSMSKRSHYR